MGNSATIEQSTATGFLRWKTERPGLMVSNEHNRTIYSICEKESGGVTLYERKARTGQITSQQDCNNYEQAQLLAETCVKASILCGGSR